MVEEKPPPKFSLKRSTVIVRPRQTLEFTEVEDAGGENTEVENLVLTIGETLRRYGEAAHQLLATKFSNQKDLVRPICNRLVTYSFFAATTVYWSDTTPLRVGNLR